MKRTAELKEVIKIVRPILQKNEVVKAGIFGSYARGEQKKSSDVDLLIKFKGRKSLLDLVGLGFDIEKALKKKVDWVTYRSIYPPLKKQILSEEVKIL